MRVLFILSTILLSSSNQAQDARQIIHQAHEKCQAIQNGHFVMVSHMKTMTDNDTASSIQEVYFKKIENDPLSPVLFHCKHYSKGEYTSDLIYTGQEQVSIRPKDSTAIVTARDRWEEELMTHNLGDFYGPFTSKKSSPLFSLSNKDAESMTFRILREENIRDRPCYVIEINDLSENDLGKILKLYGVIYHFWIDKMEMIPLQYDVTMQLLLGSDSLIQYERLHLKNYELNNLIDEHILTLDAIPAHYTIKDFVPYTEPDPLALNTSAPDWILPDLNDEHMHLSSLKGKVVLIDFFYRSCYPCLLALPGLQSLHEKYQDQGLVVVGINPVDSKESGLAEFMAKRGVTYPILLADDDLADKYRVNGYPTMFLLDKTGKVVFIQSGYGPDMEKKLEKEIKKSL